MKKDNKGEERGLFRKAASWALIPLTALAIAVAKPSFSYETNKPKQERAESLDDKADNGYNKETLVITDNGHYVIPDLTPSKEKEKNFYFKAGGGYEWNFLPEKQDYTTDLTNKLRDGSITMEPTSNVTDVKPATNLSMTNVEAGYGIKLDKDLILWLNGGYAFGKTNTSYSSTGKGNVSGDNKPITRTEENNFSKTKIGAKLEKDFKNFAIGAGAWIDFYNLDHKANLTWQWPAVAYTQWRDYSATGNSIGSSVEGFLSWQPFDWLSVSGSLGYNWGKIDAKGEEIITASTTPGYSVKKEYNPQFNLDSFFIKTGVDINF